MLRMGFYFAEYGTQALLAFALTIIGTGVWFDARARSVANLIQLTRAHRELWERMYEDQSLVRVLNPEINLESSPLTPEEEIFLVFVILHLSSTYYAMKAGFYKRLHGLQKDIERFFALPLPKAVWKKVKDLQDEPFVSFVERSFRSE